MDFYAVVDQVVDLLRTRGRLSYHALKIQFELDNEQLDGLKEELLYAHQGDVAEEGPGLVWTGPLRTAPPEQEDDHAGTAAVPTPISAGLTRPNAERRRLTILFCDLVDSTPLSGRLDPEELREVVLAYQNTCAKVIARYEGHIANYLGDGLLVYFGYPRAHEGDAERAVRTGLGILEAIGQLNRRLSDERSVSLSVRLGCHTGLVVVDDLTDGTRHDQQAFGETLNIAARLQGVAAPNTLVVSASTHRLLGGTFACESIGTPTLKGVAQPLNVYTVLHESTARTRLEVLGNAGLTTLVGRESELALLRERWVQVESGEGQVVLLSGEAGIGKSRLVQAITEHAVKKHGWLTPCQGSPYHQHTAFYPMIDLLERVVVRFDRTDSPKHKLARLEGYLVENGQSLQHALPNFAALLSIPLDDNHTSQEVSPEQQKQDTMRALLEMLLHRAAKQPLVLVVDDLQWVDPTTLELLDLLTSEIATTRILALMVYRPDFSPLWSAGSNVTELKLTGLARGEAQELARRAAHGKTLPEEVLAQIVARTDGIPLFIEELTKMLLESGLLEERAQQYDLAGPLPPLAIPDTLNDSLMARLDRLSMVKNLIQQAAVLGREFTYTLLNAVSPWGEETLRSGLEQLVAAEFLHQHGSPPEAKYRFKHALIQDAAYQSMLKATRQRQHQSIAQVLESQITESIATRPELLAHHYTEAGLAAEAVPYWQAAATRALQHSANREATAHVRRGLEVLGTLPETDERKRQELTLQLMLGAALGAPGLTSEWARIYTRACELAREVGTNEELFPALWGNWYAHMATGRATRARALAEEYLVLAQQQHDRLVLAAGHRMVANIAWWQGDFVDALNHSRRGLALWDPEQLQTGAVSFGQDSGVNCGYMEAFALWALGYPDQSAQKIAETLARARALGHLFSVAQTLNFAAHLYQLLRDPHTTRRHAEEALALCEELGFKQYGSWSLLPRGWAVAQQGSLNEGFSYIRDAVAARLASNATGVLPWFYALLGQTYSDCGQLEESAKALDEALVWVDRTGEHMYEAEIYRLKGELAQMEGLHQPVLAEGYFEQALSIARHQHAKSWELRAATSLSRLWLRRNKQADVRRLLRPIYDWFSEGFETPDLHDAKALLDEID